MKILLLGGTGVISTEIVRLMAQGNELILLNRRGTVPQGITGARAVACDRQDAARLEEIVRGLSPFDCVMDMVCFLPEEAKTAVRVFSGRTKQYIFCSTVDVYTKTEGRYSIREDAPRQPSECFSYAWNKARCEEILMEAHNQGALTVTILRPAATYSELRLPLVSSVDGGTFLLDRMLRGKPIVSHNDGLSVWSECHAIDVARGFAAACGNSECYGECYHLTGEEWMSWDRILRTACAAIGAPEPNIVHIPTGFLSRFDPAYGAWCLENFRYNQIFDNQKAARALGFRYTLSWEEGFRRYYQNFLERGEIPETWDSHPRYDSLLDAWAREGW